MNYYKISFISSPLESLTYFSELIIKDGTLVEVLLNNRQLKGVVVSSCEKPAFDTLEIIEVKFVDRHSMDYNKSKLDLVDSIITDETLRNHLFKYKTRDFVSNNHTEAEANEILNYYLARSTDEEDKNKGENKGKNEGKNKDKNEVIVVSHHAPLITGICHPRYLPKDKKTGKLDRCAYGNYAFSSDLERLLGDPIVAWIFGHTHYRVQYQHPSGTIIAQNHLGYVSKPYQSVKTL